MTKTSRRSLLAGTLASGLMAQGEAAREVRLPRRIRLALAGYDGHPEEILRVLPQLIVQLGLEPRRGIEPGAKIQHHGRRLGIPPSAIAGAVVPSFVQKLLARL